MDKNKLMEYARKADEVRSAVTQVLLGLTVAVAVIIGFILYAASHR